MLKEYAGVSQDGREPGYRRWFEDSELELIAWFGDTDEIRGFQLVYRRDDDRYAFTWMRDGGYSHTRIDEGDSLPGPNRSPVLMADGAFPYRDVVQRFTARAAGLEPELRELVIMKINECGGTLA